MNAVFINGKRNGYGPEECGKTMTVGEMIEMLEGYDEDAPVYLRNDNGYTYGSITRWDLCASEDYDEEEFE